MDTNPILIHITKAGDPFSLSSVWYEGLSQPFILTSYLIHLSPVDPIVHHFDSFSFVFILSRD